MIQVKTFYVVMILAVAVCSDLLSAAEVTTDARPGLHAKSEDLFFESDVRPILKAHCIYCHGEDGEVKGGVDLRQVRLMTEADAIDAAAPANSRLLEVLETGEMPMEGKPSTATARQRANFEIIAGAGQCEIAKRA